VGTNVPQTGSQTALRGGLNTFGLFMGLIDDEKKKNYVIFLAFCRLPFCCSDVTVSHLHVYKNYL